MSGPEWQPLGLTKLAAPPDEITPSIDIIFVHGLGGGAIKTWSKNLDRNLCWPEKFLPQDIPNARVYAFGYNANFSNRAPSAENIVDFGRELLRVASTSTDDIGVHCPLIFIVHSMGGLVTKEAILQSKTAGDGFAQRITAILFMGTPHRGSLGATTIHNMLDLSPIHTTKRYVEDLKKNSANLERINETFRKHAKGFKLYSFYELVATKIGPKSEMVVEADSSIMCYPGEQSVAVEGDHHTIVKYDGQDDPKYIKVIDTLRLFLAAV